MTVTMAHNQRTLKARAERGRGGDCTAELVRS